MLAPNFQIRPFKITSKTYHQDKWLNDINGCKDLHAFFDRKFLVCINSKHHKLC